MHWKCTNVMHNKICCAAANLPQEKWCANCIELFNEQLLESDVMREIQYLIDSKNNNKYAKYLTRVRKGSSN
jgi:hypothetical protein